MVKNSTNIKTNNHLSHQLTEHLKITTIGYMTLKIQALFRDRNRYVAPLTRLMGFQLSSTSYLHLQPQYSYKQTIDKPAQIHFLSKRPYTITESN
jgi:hypothetical protein